MSGVVSFDDSESTWLMAGWAFNGFLHHVQTELKTEPHLQDLVRRAMALHGLHLQLLVPEDAERLLPVLLRVSDEVVAGKRLVRVEGRVLDGRSQKQFRVAVADLRERLRTYHAS